MIEILRESPQSSWTLIFFLIIVIYIYLYNDDARRFRYFFLSLFNKQYQVSYGRQSKVSGHLYHYFFNNVSFCIFFTLFIFRILF